MPNCWRRRAADFLLSTPSTRSLIHVFRSIRVEVAAFWRSSFSGIFRQMPAPSFSGPHRVLPQAAQGVGADDRLA